MGIALEVNYHINISARNLQNRARFSELVEMSPKSSMLQSQLTKTKISQHDINISAQNLQNRAHFSKLVKMSPNSGMLWSKLTKT